MLTSMRRFAGITIAVFGTVAACDDTSDTGQGLVDGSSSTCPTSSTCPSFASDIYPSMKASGAWKCADATCHGGGTFRPAVDDSSASACLASLQQITIRGKPYVKSGSKDPDESSLLCNVKGTCGEQMPKEPAPFLSTTEICKVEAWLRCGAPP